MKRLSIVTLLAAVLGVMLSPAAVAQYVPPPTADVGDTDPRPGSQELVFGANWCPGSEVSIYLDGQFVTTATVGDDGTFEKTITIPENADPGEHTIEVVGLDETCQEVRSVTITINIRGGEAGGAAGLAFTGSNIWAGVLLLLALLIVGTTALVAGRRRKAAADTQRP